MNSLDHYKNIFNSVGWFIPPYVTMGFLSNLAKKITDSSGSFTQHDLEKNLSLIYSAENLASMVLNRYPITPYIQDYKVIISECVKAHFMGLDHIAVSGLMPVIEGAANKLAIERSALDKKSICNTFINLANDCKNEAQQKRLGSVGEVLSMLDSFSEYANNHLYIHSKKYPHTDNTNRHGILHGAYSDDDYGDPINFYKAIAAVDFLCFISAFRASISWLAPSPTEESKKLALHYIALSVFTF